MHISDVIGELRETQLRQSMKIKALEAQQAMLERFTWNLLRDLGLIPKPIAEPAVKEALQYADTPLYFQTLIDLAAPEADLGSPGSAS